MTGQHPHASTALTTTMFPVCVNFTQSIPDSIVYTTLLIDPIKHEILGVWCVRSMAIMHECVNIL